MAGERVFRATVRRFDFARFDGPQVLPNGWLRADALIARTGIQAYVLGDGSVRREYRAPEEVFHPDSLASFAMVPVTDDHPPGLLDATNARLYAKGHLGEEIRKAGDKVLASVLVTDGDLVRKVLDGKVELSAGYTCELVFEPGEADGEAYDCRQVNVRGNHVAVVDAGRAGPEVRIKLDSSDGVASTRLDLQRARGQMVRDAEEAWRKVPTIGMTAGAVVGPRDDGPGLERRDPR